MNRRTLPTVSVALMGLFLPRRSVESLFRAIAMAKRLYVGNLKYTVTSEELQEMFEQYGTVSTAQVLSDRETGRSRGFGFVEMDNDDEALAAIESLDGQDHDGRRLTVNEARPRTPGGGRRVAAAIAAAVAAVIAAAAAAVAVTATIDRRPDRRPAGSRHRGRSLRQSDPIGDRSRLSIARSDRSRPGLLDAIRGFFIARRIAVIGRSSRDPTLDSAEIAVLRMPACSSDAAHGPSRSPSSWNGSSACWTSRSARTCEPTAATSSSSGSTRTRSSRSG